MNRPCYSHERPFTEYGMELTTGRNHSLWCSREAVN